MSIILYILSFIKYSWKASKCSLVGLRKRHAPITDTDSDESLTASQSQSKASVPKKPYVPRFLIIHLEIEGKDISLLSPFLIHKTIMSMAGEPKTIKNLRSGDLLIQCAKEPHEKSLLKMKYLWTEMLRSSS